jgi:Holliday junction resolvasome RuvABC endonuclease subunit
MVGSLFLSTEKIFGLGGGNYFMPIKILGLDPGLAHTGWCLIYGENEPSADHYGVLETVKWADKERTFEVPMRDRIDHISDNIQKLIARYEPHFLVMEDFTWRGSKGVTGSQMPALIENIRVMGRVLGYDVAIFTTAQWKRLLLGNGTATKVQVQHCVHKKLGLDEIFWDAHDKGGHIRDAMALGLTQWKKLHGKGDVNGSAHASRGNKRPKH